MHDFYCSVIVPVYRGAPTLPLLADRVSAVFSARNQSYELIFVEDGGGDTSWDVIGQLSQVDPRVKGIRLRRNFGQHNAILCGIRAARGTTIVTIDDDLQNPPDEIARLLDKLEEGFDVVYGAPNNQTHGFLRNTASRVVKFSLRSSMGAANASNVSSFRAFRTSLRDAFGNYQSPTVSIDVLLTWGTSAFSSVVVRQDKRQGGQSGYSLARLVIHAFNMMTGFSTLPLQFASLTGFAFAVFGFILLAYVLIQYLIVGSAVPGFAFIASMVAIFSGVQLFAIGIIGEYLGRIHLRTMNRPPYFVHEETARRGEGL
jgi:glycosyltransferase involved in cell wall biosynthesis